MDTNTPIAFFDGKLLPFQEVRLPINDVGFVWGATVTDLCRTIRHEIYRWEDHLERFQQSCRATGIHPPVSAGEITQLASEIVRHNSQLISTHQELSLVMSATPGRLGYYLGESGGIGDGPATFLMHTFPMDFGRYRHLFSEGARLVIPSVRHVPPECVEPRIKQRSRMHWWLADQQAKQVDPKASALLLNSQGHITETAAANFLVVKEGTVMSPMQNEILGGTSLQVVREICGKIDIPFKEQPIQVYDCVTADEAMLTCTSFFLAGVNRINEVQLTWPGPIFQQLLETWSQDVNLDIREQFL